VQHCIHLGREHVLDAVALLPRRAKTVGVVAAAEEARAMAGGEGGGFI
jgi:hypothetical protein